MTKIPFPTEHGAASFDSETFGQIELLANGPSPTVRTAETVGENTELAMYSVVGRNADGNLVMATFGTTDPARATGTLTFSGVALADETVVIDGTTYVFKAAVGATANEVLIGADAAACAANLIAAINAAPQTEGSEVYGTDTAQNPDVVASQGSTAAEIEVVARVAGQEGEVATTETLTNGAWGSATLTGGVGGGTQPVGVLTAAVATGAGETVEVDVFRDGTFNGNALTWDASYNTARKRERAFEGSISPGLYVKHHPYDAYGPTLV